MSKKPKILVTNDDGIHAPGLRFLWQALQDIADLYIIAPASEKSGVGLGLTTLKPIFIRPVKWEKETPAWQVSGTPGDCIRLALSTILDFTPDLIVSGINRGSNAGRTVPYSGTVGAAMEGSLRSISSLAFSCVDFENPCYELTLPYIVSMVLHYLKSPLPQGTLMNVNFPHADTILGIKMAKQGKGFWIESPEERQHPEGHSYYWLGGRWFEIEEEEDSDVHLLKQGYATAVPIHVAQLTDFSYFSEHEKRFNEQMEKGSRAASSEAFRTHQV
ncbi:MAG: 5-nucleotidase surE [Chlamydiota bacterium]|jgi:5'-nucleotidase